jgi:hypothetical protein
MSKRDYMSEIKELQRRLPDTAHNIIGHQEAISELVGLYPSDELTPAHAIAITHYISVRLVAVLQSAFRAVIREAADYNARHEKPLPKIEEKITLEMVREFASNAVTIGEFLSHLVPLNSFEQMQRSFELVAGIPLRGVVSPSFAESAVKDASFSTVEHAIQQLFKERNIICHEIRENEAIAKETLGKWLVAVLLMVTALGFYESQFIELS